MPYIFPAAVRAQLSIAVALQLQDYLQGGSEAFGLAGLSGAPVFTIREGTEAPGDESVTAMAQVIFPDDLSPGVPFVRVMSVMPLSSPDEWGDDQERSRFRVVLDCDASEFQGTITGGNVPGGADAVLSDVVWNLVSHFDAMREAGFWDANATPGAGDIQGIEYHIPITLEFEIYVSKT